MQLIPTDSHDHSEERLRGQIQGEFAAAIEAFTVLEEAAGDLKTEQRSRLSLNASGKNTL